VNNKSKEQQKNKLEWALREWDCNTVEDAIQKAKGDSELHRILRECGVCFPKEKS